MQYMFAAYVYTFTCVHIHDDTVYYCTALFTLTTCTFSLTTRMSRGFNAAITGS